MQFMRDNQHAECAPYNHQLRVWFLKTPLGFDSKKCTPENRVPDFFPFDVSCSVFPEVHCFQNFNWFVIFVDCIFTVSY